uniref:Uncharacterized protein n=1 Tax=uncultured marine microorganism HF4000_APKG8D23 TaxID=455554 RepID=B3TAK1_9ZZZZ|nr:hypothetical protein ALOHA_HF4000APKG8D23ctg1g28 [uncultured marine microorganism HF4000_APKG8D23]
MRKARGREDGQFLSAHQCGAAVDGADAGLNELSGTASTVRVDGRTYDVSISLRNDVGASVARLAVAGENPPDEVLAHRQAEHVAEESHPSLAIDAARALEHLHDDHVIAGVEHLAVLGAAIGQPQADDLPECHGLGLVEEDQWSLHVRNSPVLLVRHSSSPLFRGLRGGCNLCNHVIHQFLDAFLEALFEPRAHQQASRLDIDHVLECGASGHGLLGCLLEGEDGFDHRILQRQRSVCVDRVECVLLEEELANHASDLKCELLVHRQRVRADQLHDLLQLRLDLQQRRYLSAHVGEIRGDVVSVPRVEGPRVEAVRSQPVYRGEMALPCELGVEAPEHLHDAKRSLADGLRDVTAGW